MNPFVVRLANRTRARIVASHWRDRWAVNHPVIAMPLPLMARCWPHVRRDAPYQLAWPTYRWPLNAARWFVAHSWQRAWDGSRRPMPQALGRLVWTVSAAALGVAALLVATLLTFLAIPVWVAANIGGAVLIVIGGWSAPAGGAIRNLDTARLTEWAATVEDELIEPPVNLPSSHGTPAQDPSDWNNANDPLLAAQRESTAELRRHNDLLEAQQRADRTAAAARHPSQHSPYDALSAPPVRGDGPHRRRWRPLLVATVVVASSLFGGAVLLSIAATWSDSAVPPTFAEIETGIHQRTAERQAQLAANLEQRYPDVLGAEP